MPKEIEEGVIWLAAVEELEDETWCGSRDIGLFVNCIGKD